MKHTEIKETYKDLLILENDSFKIPHYLQDILDETSIPFEIWFWFAEDVRQNTQKSFARFAAIKSTTFLITSPSFVGLGNSFEGKLFLFKKLMEAGIKINIGVMYYPDFYWFLVKWLHETGAYIGSQKKKNLEINSLKKCLSFHRIYRLDSNNVLIEDQPLFESMELITWETLMPNYFPTKLKVKVKSTGEIWPIYWTYINIDDPEKSEITLHMPDQPNNKFKLSEIEHLK